MVSAAIVRSRNTRFANVVTNNHDGSSSRQICVFAGATSGIGASTLTTLVKILPAPLLYVIGRSKARFANQEATLTTINPRCTIVFLEGEFSLLAEVDHVSKRIIESSAHVDYLYMSPGMIPLNGPHYTQEGLETCFSISFYARMRLLQNLIPLLEKAPAPRVVSVLNGGKEPPMHDDDIGLERHWSPLSVVGHATTMTSLTFHHLAQQNAQITFLHCSPGWVKTDNFVQLTTQESSSLVWKACLFLIRWVATCLALVFGTSLQESGERQVYHLLDQAFTPGSWGVDHLSNAVPPNRVLQRYIEQGWPELVRSHTSTVFEKTMHDDRDL